MNDTALVRTSAVDPEVTAAIAITERLKPLKEALGIKDLTDQEVQLFGMVAQRSRLDPFAKQIYAIKRKGKVSYQTGIDGYRSIAARTNEYAGSDEATFEICTCSEKPEGHPSVARVTVHRIHSSGRILDQVGIARWHELKPAPGEYNADARWIQMPFNQLAKCAEANGLRKIFPTVLADIYIEDEMAQAGPPENGALVTAAAQPTAPARLAARRAALEGQVIDPPAGDSEPIDAVATEVVDQGEAVAAPAPDGDRVAATTTASPALAGYELFKARLALADPRPTHVAIVELAIKQTSIPDLALKDPRQWPLRDPAWIRLANALDLPQLSKEA